MDPTKLLEADHRTVEDLFTRIEQAEGEARTPLLAELGTALKAHMELEEQTLYPSMGPITGDEAVEEANTEHGLARKALKDLLGLAPDQPGFGAALAACRAGIAHHVDEEENEVFPELRKDAQLLAELATPFMHRRLELGLPVDAQALAASATKDELAAEAEAAGIDLRSSMTKQDIADALAEQLSATS